MGENEPQIDDGQRGRTAKADDHLAELLFAGDGGSSGAYSPHRTTLALAGTDPATDHVVYLHEIHHSGLNDSTAWGSALHIYARLPEPYRSRFLPLLNACRLPHEAFATFAGVSVAAARHESGAAAALAHYPRYIPLHNQLASLVGAAGGPHRRYMAATAVARVTMQTQILHVMDEGDLHVSPADLKMIDTPNGRWQWLTRNGQAILDQAVAEADAALAGSPGQAALLADAVGEDPSSAASDEFDEAWESWERVVYAELAHRLTAAGATTLDFNGHLEPTASVIERAQEIEPLLGLAAQLRGPARDDRTLAASVSDHVRLAYGEHWKANMLTVDTDELTALVDQTSRIANQPSLVIDVRLPHRLLELYRWTNKESESLATQRSPIVAVRVIAEDGSGASTILQSVIQTPADLERLTAQWGTRGPVISILAASCLIDRPWQDEWLSPLRAVGPSLILIDIELARFVGSWAKPDVTVEAGLIEVNDTAGGRWALALTASNQPTLWITLTDEITARLLLEQLDRTPELQLTHGTEHITRWKEVLPIALTHLLATESFFDFAGLQRRDADNQASENRK